MYVVNEMKNIPDILEIEQGRVNVAHSLGAETNTQAAAVGRRDLLSDRF